MVGNFLNVLVDPTDFIPGRYDGELITPKSLNVWLMANQGYTCAAGHSIRNKSRLIPYNLQGTAIIWCCSVVPPGFAPENDNLSFQVLDSISRLTSSVTLVGESKHSWEDLLNYVKGSFFVLLHVRNNHHFVLATGVASSPQTFTVLDPMLYTDE